MHVSTVKTDQSRAEQSRPRAKQSGRRARRLAPGWARVAVAAAISTLGFGVAAGSAAAASTPVEGSANYQFATLDNANDVTFNQLLGINDSGEIAGYFGSGEEGHPNKGYLLLPPYGQANYENENFPHSEQTQVTGLNNVGTMVGFWVNEKGDQIGWDAVAKHGFESVEHSHTSGPAKVNQLLGVNDSNIAVGFYTDKGVNYGYSYDITTRKFHSVTVAEDTNVTAAAINNQNEIAGFATNSAEVVEGFLERPNGTLIRLKVPGASETTALGLNNGDEVVGSYKNSTGLHGFAWTPGFGFQTINDPDGVNTVINGVNNHGELVGFYEDSSKNTDGLLAIPNEG
jgi:hypothetical protein